VVCLQPLSTKFPTNASFYNVCSHFQFITEVEKVVHVRNPLHFEDTCTLS